MEPKQPIITQQPTGIGGSGLTANLAGCPPGLEFFANIDKFTVVQEMEAIQVVTGFQTKNAYSILNPEGKQIYYAFEESECCERAVCKYRRSFIMHIVDTAGREVMTIRREINCVACLLEGRMCLTVFCLGCTCIKCCQDKIRVEAPPGNHMVEIRQQCILCIPRPYYHAIDASGAIIFQIFKPFLCKIIGDARNLNVCCCWCRELKFTVHVDGFKGVKIGEIHRKWAGVWKSVCTQADTYAVSFPPQMQVTHKAALAAATLFIDFMHFERGGKGLLGMVPGS